MQHSRKALLVLVSLVCGIANAAEYKAGEIIVKYKDSVLRTRTEMNDLYESAGVQSVIYPWHRITFLEIMVSEEERGSVIDFFRT